MPLGTTYKGGNNDNDYFAEHHADRQPYRKPSPMSQLLINDYLKQLDLIKKVSGSQRETIVREAFKDLLKAEGRQHGLVFLAEYPLKTATKSNIAVDGALLHELRMPLGYWEAKDEKDDLDSVDQA